VSVTLRQFLNASDIDEDDLLDAPIGPRHEMSGMTIQINVDTSHPGDVIVVMFEAVLFKQGIGGCGQRAVGPIPDG
jgi:hypothetical protein